MFFFSPFFSGENQPFRSPKPSIWGQVSILQKGQLRTCFVYWIPFASQFCTIPPKKNKARPSNKSAGWATPFMFCWLRKRILRFRSSQWLCQPWGSNSLRRLSLLDTSCLALPGAQLRRFGGFGWSNDPKVHWCCGERYLPIQTTSWNLWFLST